MGGEAKLKRIDAGSLAREVLAHASAARLSFLLERGVPVAALRDFARKHDLTIKGYRIDRAPAVKLAPAIAKSTGDQLEEACQLWIDSAVAAVDKSAAAPPAPASDTVSKAAHRLLERRLADAEKKVAKSEERIEKERARVDEMRQKRQAEVENQARLKAEIRELQKELKRARQGADRKPTDQSRQIHELERDLEALGEAEEGLRRLLALRDTRLRDAEGQIAELEELVPKGRRRKKPRLVVDAPRERFRVPYFTEAYYKTLVNKERVSVEKAMQAVFQFCVEGPAYPGLEVKQIEGQDLWSLRASLKLRVYFRMRADGDVDVLALADREDQRTTLRRLKER